MTAAERLEQLGREILVQFLAAACQTLEHGVIRRDEFDDTLRISTTLLGDSHDLIHKAVGWMLREVGKRDERVLERFLDEHALAMPRTALRYSIERMSPAKRKRYMAR